MPITLDRNPVVSVGATAARWLKIDMRKFTEHGITELAGTPTMAQVGGSNLVITEVGYNEAITYIDGKPVPIGQAVVGFISGFAIGLQTVLVTIEDNSSQVEPFNVTLDGV